MGVIKISLAAARVNAGFTQAEVAAKMHVSKQTICSWERGKASVKIEQGIALSKLYGIPIDHIFFDDKSN